MEIAQMLSSNFDVSLLELVKRCPKLVRSKVAFGTLTDRGISMNCPVCEKELSERGVFCGSCGSQARCNKCRSVLEAGAVACVECGARVGEIQLHANDSPSSASLRTLGLNTIIFREDKNSRSLEASLSDIALQGIGDSFGGLFLQRGAIRPPSNGRLFNRNTELINAKGLPASTSDDAVQEDRDTSNNEQPAASLSDQARIDKIFRMTGDSLELVDNRVKATNLSDYVRRLTYLFLYAQECYGHTSTRENDVVELLKTSKAWDKSGNSRRWLTKRVLIKDEGDEAIKLTEPGREEAVKILNQALDPSVEDKWNPDFNKPKPRGIRKKKKA
jgi:hypothetical protein